VDILDNDPVPVHSFHVIGRDVNGSAMTEFAVSALSWQIACFKATNRIDADRRFAKAVQRIIIEKVS